MSRFIVLSGNPIEGMTVFGPFSNHDKAIRWADWACDGSWLVTDLHIPTGQDEEPEELFLADIRDEEPPEQVLVTLWRDGDAEIATRASEHQAWGPPVRLERRDVR